jgi:hypothetical protein
MMLSDMVRGCVRGCVEELKAECFVVVLCYHSCRVQYTKLATPQPSPECKFSPHQEMGMKWHPVKTNDM